MNTSLQQHLDYVAITEQEIAALRAFRDTAEQHADAFVSHFYSRLMAFERTRRFLTDERVTQRLLKAQRAYLLSLFDARFDDAFYAHRRNIGHTHFRIGLEFQWYIGAYVMYLEFLDPLIEAHCASDENRRLTLHSAVRKATLMDMSIVLEAFREGDKRTLEETQSQVIHQERLAAIGLLASGMAHEIGNPLASIQAICDNQIRRGDIEPIVVEKFDRIRQQVVRMSTIVQQLVSFARPVPVQWQRVNLNDLLVNALTISLLSRSGKTIHVVRDLQEDLPDVYGAPERLTQVFLNLLLNSIDALNSAGGMLYLRSSHNGSMVTVDIEDNGCGIPPEEMGKLFNPFFTTKEVGKGTGLGLYVSAGIIKNHKGEIKVRSTRGHGATFSVILPVAADSISGFHRAQ